MAGLCDKCGQEYFASCHDCLHILSMLFMSSKKLLVLLPATGEYKEEREILISLKNFYELKVLNSVKPKED